MKKIFISAFILLFVFSSSVRAQESTRQDTDSIATTEYSDSIIDAMLMQTLPEVMVKGERPIARMERGKLTYNMQLLNERIPANNAFDALRNIPGVTIDNDEVKFAGQTMTLIINGKATTMSQEEVTERLKMIPADQMAKAEVMLSAPPYYHVRGAVINIETNTFTKKATTAGQLQGMGFKSKYESGAAKLNLLHTTGKLMLDASYKYYYGKSYAENENSAQHLLGDTRIPYYENTSRSMRDINHAYRLGGDYRFAERHMLSVAYSGARSSDRVNETSTGDANSLHRSNHHTTLHNIDADYSLPFGLRLAASYLHFDSDSDQGLTGTLFDTSRDLTSNSRQKIDKWLFAADQQHTFDNGWGLSYGAKAQFTHNNSSQKTVKPSGDVVPESTSSVDNDERIITGYVSISKQITPRLSFEASLEAEQFHNIQWDEWHLFPSLNMLWMANEKSLFNLSLSSNAGYPSYWSTMSNVHYSSVYQEVWGNPDLKPSQQYDITLVWQWRQRYTLAAFAQLHPNTIYQLPYQPTDRMAVIMKMFNLNHSNTYGVQAAAQFRSGQWLNGNVSLTAAYKQDKCDDFFDIPFNRSKWLYIASSSVSARLSEKTNLRLTLNPFFQTDAIQGVYDIKSVFTLNASLFWISNNGRWNISLDGRNLTNYYYKTISQMKNQHFEMNVINEWRTASLTVTYKFGDYKEKKHRAVDTSRMGGN